MTDEPEAEAAPDAATRAQIRRREEFERLCATGYTVCCGGGGRTRKQA